MNYFFCIHIFLVCFLETRQREAGAVCQTQQRQNLLRNKLAPETADVRVDVNDDAPLAEKLPGPGDLYWHEASN